MVPSLRVHRLSFAHNDAVPLLDAADFHLSAGWTGLVGENGAGKTTLLRLLSGELRPQAGHVHVEPAPAAIVVCPQVVEHFTAEIQAFAERSDAVARRLTGELRLEVDALQRWSTLSPGERKRWQIGAALAEDTDILLLDEPTNHLDAAGRALLVGALRRFRGVGVVVSHDRPLLAELTGNTLRIHRGSARIHPGSYEAARRAWEAEERVEIEAHHRRRDEQKILARRLDDARRTQTSADAGRSSKARMKDRHDHDARDSLAKGRAASADKRAGKTVGIVRRELDRATATVSAIVVEKDVGRSLFVGYTRATSPWLFQLDSRAIYAGEAPLLGAVKLGFGREDRVHLEGPNGAGKTTLLRALLATGHAPAEKILHLPQELGVNEERALLAEVRALPPAERGRVLSLVAALGVEPERLLGSAQPSPGEARKLAIALGLGRHAWVCVLDEPTNHLDLPSIERLEKALVEYPGALLLVTHDRALARACARTTWKIDRGRVEIAA